jgi:hypothetical protein
MIPLNYHVILIIILIPSLIVDYFLLLLKNKNTDILNII